MYEKSIDFNHTTLQGSSSSIFPSQQVISQLRIDFDKIKFMQDAYERCLNTSACADYIEVSDAEVINSLVEYFKTNIEELAEGLGAKGNPKLEEMRK